MNTGNAVTDFDNSPSPQWPDRDLISACLAGDERAWSALVEKYKNLVYSAPMRYRMLPEDAADVFQSVWTELFSQLRNLRDVDALSGWLITVSINKCYQWKRKRSREVIETGQKQEFDMIDPRPLFPVVREQLDRQQRLRSAMGGLPERCRTMIQMLFFTEPPRPYAEVARDLGLAVGSIGFIRGRCLKKLRRALEEVDF